MPGHSTGYMHSPGAPEIGAGTVPHSEEAGGIMISKAFRFLVLVTAVGWPLVGAAPADAQDEDAATMAAALKDAKLTLQEGLKAGEREGQPISAQFEIDDGKLRLSVYTVKGDDFTEVVADPKTGAVMRAEKITDADELNDAADQKAAMAKA